MEASGIVPTREFWKLIREALLSAVNAIELLLEIRPRTSELRREWRTAQKERM